MLKDTGLVMHFSLNKNFSFIWVSENSRNQLQKLNQWRPFIVCYNVANE